MRAVLKRRTGMMQVKKVGVFLTELSSRVVDVSCQLLDDLAKRFFHCLRYQAQCRHEVADTGGVEKGCVALCGRLDGLYSFHEMHHARSLAFEDRPRCRPKILALGSWKSELRRKGLKTWPASTNLRKSGPRVPSGRLIAEAA